MENAYGMGSSGKGLKTALELAKEGGEAKKRPSVYEAERDEIPVPVKEETVVGAAEKPETIEARWAAYANERYGDPREYSPEQMLNDEKFISFIENAREEEKAVLYERIKDPALLQEHYDAFRYTDRVIESLASVHSGVLKEQLGIDISKEILEQSNQEIAKLARENPSYVKALYAGLAEYQNTERVIHEKQEKVAEILKKSGSESLVSLQEKTKRLQLVARTRGFFNVKNSEVLGWLFRTTEESAARRDAFYQHKGSLREIPTLAQEAQEQLKTATDASKWIEKITEICAKQRSELLLQTTMSEGLCAIAHAAVGEHVKKLLGGKTGTLGPTSSLKELQGAVDYHNRFRALREKGGPDFTGVFNEDEREFETKLTGLAEVKFKEHLTENIKKVKIPTINKLKEAITPLLKERIGFHSDEAARERALQFVREVSGELGSPLARMAFDAALEELKAGT